MGTHGLQTAFIDFGLSPFFYFFGFHFLFIYFFFAKTANL